MRGEQYLTSSSQYGLVYNSGSTWTNRLMVMKALPNGLGFSRYGFSISRRVGKAVVRNMAKRRLREILRREPLQPGWDIVIIVRSPAASASYAELAKSVSALLRRGRLLAEEYEGVCPGTN